MPWDMIGLAKSQWFNGKQDFYVLGADTLAQIINKDKVREKATGIKDVLASIESPVNSD
jgi:hypothetical protein